jgi:hypothetical protein
LFAGAPASSECVNDEWSRALLNIEKLQLGRVSCPRLK